MANRRNKKARAKRNTNKEIVSLSHSAFGSKEFSKAFDECASGKIADAYRSYTHNDHLDTTSIQDRINYFDHILRSDEIARKILKLPILDSISNWRDSDYIWEEPLGVRDVVKDASIFARTYGISVIFPIIKDITGSIVPSTRTLQSILDSGEEFIIDKIIYTTDNLTLTGEIETDFYKPWYGYPKRLKIGNRDVHPSRVAFIGDVYNPFLLSIKDDLADYHESKRRLEIAVRRNTGIILQSNWAEISKYITAKQDVGAPAPTMQEITTERARSLYENVNDVNVAVINTGESVQFYQQSNIQELIENVKLHMQVLTASSDIVLSKLFGVLQSTGLGNSSDTEFLNYAQSLESLRADFIEPGVRQLDDIVNSVLGIGVNGWEWNPTRAEELRTDSNGGQA